MPVPLEKPNLLARIDPFAKMGRRGAARLRLSVPAKLVSLYAAHRCIVLDLSRTGAQIVLEAPLPAGDGAFLKVHRLDQFCSIVRSSAAGNGLEFEVPLTEEQVLDMRRFGEEFEELEKREWREVARAWVAGGH